MCASTVGVNKTSNGMRYHCVYMRNPLPPTGVRKAPCLRLLGLPPCPMTVRAIDDPLTALEPWAEVAFQRKCKYFKKYEFTNV